MAVLLDQSGDALDIMYDFESQLPLITAFLYNETYGREKEFLQAYSGTLPNPKLPQIVVDAITGIFVTQLGQIERTLREHYTKETFKFRDYAKFLQEKIHSCAQDKTQKSIQKANSLYNRLRIVSPSDAHNLTHSGMMDTISNIFERQQETLNDSVECIQSFLSTQISQDSTSRNCSSQLSHGTSSQFSQTSHKSQASRKAMIASLTETIRDYKKFMNFRNMLTMDLLENINLMEKRVTKQSKPVTVLGNWRVQMVMSRLTRHQFEMFDNVFLDHNINRLALILCEPILRHEIIKLNDLITNEVAKWIDFSKKVLFRVCKAHEGDNKIFVQDAHQSHYDQYEKLMHHMMHFFDSDQILEFIGKFDIYPSHHQMLMSYYKKISSYDEVIDDYDFLELNHQFLNDFGQIGQNLWAPDLPMEMKEPIYLKQVQNSNHTVEWTLDNYENTVEESHRKHLDKILDKMEPLRDTNHLPKMKIICIADTDLDKSSGYFIDPSLRNLYIIKKASTHELLIQSTDTIFMNPAMDAATRRKVFYYQTFLNSSYDIFNSTTNVYNIDQVASFVNQYSSRFKGRIERVRYARSFRYNNAICYDLYLKGQGNEGGFDVESEVALVIPDKQDNSRIDLTYELVAGAQISVATQSEKTVRVLEEIFKLNDDNNHVQFYAFIMEKGRISLKTALMSLQLSNEERRQNLMLEYFSEAKLLQYARSLIEQYQLFAIHGISNPCLQLDQVTVTRDLKCRVNVMWGTQILNKGSRRGKRAFPYMVHSKISPKTLVNLFRGKQATTDTDDFYKNELNMLTQIINGLWNLCSRHFQSIPDYPTMNRNIGNMLEKIGTCFSGDAENISMLNLRMLEDWKDIEHDFDLQLFQCAQREDKFGCFQFIADESWRRVTRGLQTKTKEIDDVMIRFFEVMKINIEAAIFLKDFAAVKEKVTFFFQIFAMKSQPMLPAHAEYILEKLGLVFELLGDFDFEKQFNDFMNQDSQLRIYYKFQLFLKYQVYYAIQMKYRDIDDYDTQLKLLEEQCINLLQEAHSKRRLKDFDKIMGQLKYYQIDAHIRKAEVYQTLEPHSNQKGLKELIRHFQDERITRENLFISSQILEIKNSALILFLTIQRKEFPKEGGESTTDTVEEMYEAFEKKTLALLSVYADSLKLKIDQNNAKDLDKFIQQSKFKKDKLGYNEQSIKDMHFLFWEQLYEFFFYQMILRGISYSRCLTIFYPLFEKIYAKLFDGSNPDHHKHICRNPFVPLSHKKEKVDSFFKSTGLTDSKKIRKTDYNRELYKTAYIANRMHEYVLQNIQDSEEQKVQFEDYSQLQYDIKERMMKEDSDAYTPMEYTDINAISVLYGDKTKFALNQSLLLIQSYPMFARYQFYDEFTKWYSNVTTYHRENLDLNLSYGLAYLSILCSSQLKEGHVLPNLDTESLKKCIDYIHSNRLRLGERKKDVYYNYASVQKNFCNNWTAGFNHMYFVLIEEIPPDYKDAIFYIQQMMRFITDDLDQQLVNNEGDDQIKEIYARITKYLNDKDLVKQLELYSIERIDDDKKFHDYLDD